MRTAEGIRQRMSRHGLRITGPHHHHSIIGLQSGKTLPIRFRPATGADVQGEFEVEAFGGCKEAAAAGMPEVQ